VAALHALRELWRDDDVERVLHQFSRGASAEVRKEAAWTLRSTASTATWRRLFDLWCEDALPRHRAWACELAGMHGSHDVLTALDRLTHDVDGHVRHAAAHAIRQIKAERRGLDSHESGRHSAGFD
jgi:HEAT repeat protein